MDVLGSARNISSMTSEQIRKLVARRPFRRLEILVDGGEKLIARHPEAVLVGKELIVVELPDGTMDYVEARNVSKVRVLSRRASPR
jgi:hypothetical protein